MAKRPFARARPRPGDSGRVMEDASRPGSACVAKPVLAQRRRRPFARTAGCGDDLDDLRGDAQGRATEFAGMFAHMLFGRRGGQTEDANGGPARSRHLEDSRQARQAPRAKSPGDAIAGGGPGTVALPVLLPEPHVPSAHVSVAPGAAIGVAVHLLGSSTAKGFSSGLSAFSPVTRLGRATALRPPWHRAPGTPSPV